MAELNYLGLWDHCWGNSSQLLGDVILEWSICMSLLYSLPNKFELLGAEDLRSKMAKANGDGLRIGLLTQGFEKTAIGSGGDACEKAKMILAKLKVLSGDRNNIVHGIPMLKLVDGEWQAHLAPAKSARIEARPMKMPEAAQNFLEELKPIKEELFWLASPISMNEWQVLRGRA